MRKHVSVGQALGPRRLLDLFFDCLVVASAAAFTHVAKKVLHEWIQDIRNRTDGPRHEIKSRKTLQGI